MEERIGKSSEADAYGGKVPWGNWRDFERNPAGWKRDYRIPVLRIRIEVLLRLNLTERG
jgi:hypothetical protein